MLRHRLLGLACLLPAGPVFAQIPGGIEDNETTLIYATVSSVCTVETSTPVALVQLAPGPQDVTDVLYTCNSLNGFTRRVSSQHAGTLVRDAQGVAYLVSQTGSGNLAIPLLSLETLHNDQVAAFPELAIGSSGILRVEIPAVPAGLFAGNYVDTITIEITPN